MRGSNLKSYIRFLLLGIVLMSLVFFTRGLPLSGAKDLLLRLSDSSFLPAVLFLGLGLMNLIARDGQFNSLRYMAHRLSCMFKWGYPRKMPMKYSEFVSKEKEKYSVKPILVVGLFFLMIALLSNILFNRA